MTAISLSGCATNKALNTAYADKARAGTTAAALRSADAAIAEARRMPDYPSECRRQWRSGVVLGEARDVALVKTDQALGGANRQIAACAEWYDRTQSARGQP